MYQSHRRRCIKVIVVAVSKSPSSMYQSHQCINQSHRPLPPPATTTSDDDDDNKDDNETTTNDERT